MKLYHELAPVYTTIFPQIFDYPAEFDYYHKHLQDYACLNVLELGCGPGFLAPWFLENLYTYVGADISEEMLSIARKNVPKGQFVLGDMRNLKIHQIFDAVLITGKSFAHMISNQDVCGALQSAYRALKPQGILMFDNFNANFIFTHFKEAVEDSYQVKDTNYKRFITNTVNLSSGFTWTADTKYYIVQNETKRIVQDSMVLRAFTKDELELLLQLNQFEPLSCEISKQDPSRIFYIAFKK